MIHQNQLLLHGTTKARTMITILSRSRNPRCTLLSSYGNHQLSLGVLGCRAITLGTLRICISASTIRRATWWIRDPTLLTTLCKMFYRSLNVNRATPQSQTAETTSRNSIGLAIGTKRMTSIEIPESKLHALKNKVVIVTGGASGIGTSMVKLYHSYGAKVIVGDVQDKQGEALVGEFNSNRPVYVHCDVTSWKDQLNLFDVALQKYGTIDVVYVNAGIGEVEDLFLDTVDADGKLCEPKYIVNEINFKGALATIKIAIHHFRRLGIKGSIVVTTSTAG